MNAIRRAVVLSSCERYVVVVLNILQTAVASRLLSVNEIGLVALGFATTQLLDSIRDVGTLNYLVQREPLTRRAARTVFTVLFLASALISLALWTSSSVVAAYYEQPALSLFLAVMSLGVLASPFASPILALMRRDLAFGSIAAINCFASIVQTVLLISLAWGGWGAVSYAWATAGWSGACVAACLFARPDLRWIYRPSLKEWRGALAFGGVSCATALVNRAYELLPVFVLSRMFALDAVGIYSRAMLVAQLPDRLLFTNISSVVLPALSHTARAGGSLSGAYLAGLTLISVVQWPALILVAALADPLVAVLLGPQWSACAPLVQVTALASLLYFPAILSYPTLVAAGGLRDTLTSSLIHLPVGAAVMIASAPWGPLGLAASQLVTMPLLILVDMAFIRRRAPFTWRQLAAALRRSALVTVCTSVCPLAAIVWAGPGGTIGLELAVATIIGAGLCWIGATAAFRHPIYDHIRAVIQLLSLRARAAGALKAAE